MSISNIKERLNDIEIAGFKAILPQYAFRRQLASTAEARQLAESEAIVWMESLLETTTRPLEVKKGDALFAQDLAADYSRYSSLSTLLRANFQALADLYIEYENTKKLKLLELTAKLRRVHQKKSSLSLGNEEYRYSLVDSFLNQDWLLSKFLSGKVCSVSPEQGIVTLPVLSQTNIRIKGVVIASGSNGRAGNSDTEVDVNVSQSLNMLDGSDDSWFEYERLDTGPCELVLNFELESSQIVNSMQLLGANLSGLSSFEIKDILFSDVGLDSISVKDLVNQDLPQSFWTCNGISADGTWNVVFLPVRARTISLKLSQRSSTQIVTLSADSREVTRDRYGIGIKEIRVFQNKYAGKGEIGSTAREYPAGLYTGIAEAEVHPPSPDLYDLNFEFSLDRGSSWSSRQNIDKERSKTFLLDGLGGDYTWRASLERQDDSFQHLETMFQKEKATKVIESLAKTFSRFNSPMSIALKEKPAFDKVFLLQPKIARRGDRLSATPISRNFGVTSAIESPVDFLSMAIDTESFHLYINGSEYTQTEDNSTIEAGEWAFSDDYRQMLLAEDLPISSQVKFVLDPELMSFKERSDGYYHQMEFLFDPDKKNIKITFLSKDVKKLNKLLPRDKRIIPLGVSFIESESVVLTSSDGTALASVASKDLVLSATDFYIDCINGVLYLESESANDQHRISLRHHTPVALSPEDYSVVFEKMKPVGILIHRNAFEAKAYTQTTDNVTEKTMDLISGSYSERDSLFTGTIDALTLNQFPIIEGSVSVASDFLEDSSVPEEIPFLDGHSEFLGLIEMKKETTSAAAADVNDLVIFNLAAGATWFSDYPVVFDNTTLFSTLVATLGDVTTTGEYFVSTSGEVTLFCAAGIPASTYSYFYRDPSFNPDRKFSVDYKKGRVYSFAAINSSSSISYKVATYIASYDIASQIDDFTYDSKTNTVSVRTENLKDFNSSIKVFWEKIDKAQNLEQLREFFSPLLTAMKIRFA
jgi:hypothetical protein